MNIIVCTRDTENGAGSQVKHEIEVFQANKLITNIFVISPGKFTGLSNKKLHYKFVQLTGKYFISKEPQFAYKCGKLISTILNENEISFIYTHHNILFFRLTQRPYLISKFHNFHLGIGSAQPINLFGITSRIVHYLYSFFDLFTLLNSSKVYFVGDNSLELVKQFFPFWKNKLNFELNSVSLKKFYVKKVNNLVINNKLFSKSQGTKYILYVGRLEMMKGIVILIDSIKIITNNNIKLIVVGDGPLHSEIIKNDFVIYAGRIDNERLIDYYNFCDLFVLSSYYENSPITIMEAIQCNCPVITSDTGNSKILLSTNNIFYPTNKIELSKKIQEYFDNYEQLAVESKSIKLRMITNYRKINYIDKFISV